MKKFFINLLKIIGFLFYSFFALVIGVGTNSAVTGWGLFLLGVGFVVWRIIKNKAKNSDDKADKKKKVENNKRLINEDKRTEKTSKVVRVVDNENPNSTNNSNLNDISGSDFKFSDWFKAKKYKNSLLELTNEITQLENNNDRLKGENDSLKAQAELKLSLKQMKPIDLDNMIAEKNEELNSKNKEYDDLISKKAKQLKEISNKKEEEINSFKVRKKAELEQFQRKNKAELADLNYHIDQKRKDIKEKNQEISNLNTKINELKDSLVDVSDQVMYEDYGLYKPRYDFANSSTYKGKLSEVRADQKQMIREGTAGEVVTNMTMNGSAAKGRSMQKKNIKQLVRSFNGESEAAINKVTKSNIEMIEKRINRSFDQLNKLNEPNGVRLSAKYLDSKLDEAHIALEYELKKEQEKELLREQRQREKEERQAQKEFAQEQAKYEKDENHYQQAQDLLQDKINSSKSEVEVESLKRKLEQLQSKLDDIREKKAKLSDRAENPTAGYVYIISNIGSFGQNVYKIGVTRRLDPMDRINELSSASVPFKFDVHALIFTDDAYKLENELHKYFDKQRVNKVNMRKEFFRLDLDEIKKVLSKHKELTFDFHEIPDAPEYRDSLIIEKKQKATSTN